MRLFLYIRTVKCTSTHIAQRVFVHRAYMTFHFAVSVSIVWSDNSRHATLKLLAVDGFTWVHIARQPRYRRSSAVTTNSLTKSMRHGTSTIQPYSHVRNTFMNRVIAEARPLIPNNKCNISCHHTPRLSTTCMQTNVLTRFWYYHINKSVIRYSANSRDNRPTTHAIRISVCVMFID